MVDTTTLLNKAKQYVESGQITAANYRDAISATRDNPEVKAYLESIFPEVNELPPEYTIDGKKVTREEYEQAVRETSPGYMGNLDLTAPVEEVQEEPTTRSFTYMIDNENLSAAEYYKRLNADLKAELESGEGLTEIKGSTRKARRNAAETRAQEVKELEAKIDETYKLAREAEFGKTITLEDIYGDFELQRKGVMPGDRIKDGEIVRVFSDDEDEINVEHIITQEDIDRSRTLREKHEAVPGDLIIVNKAGKREFLSRGKEDDTRQAVHEFVRNPNYLGNAKMFLEAVAPMPSLAYVPRSTIPGGIGGGGYIIPVEEVYGEDISDLSFDERRLAAKRRKERNVSRLMGPMFDYNPDSTGATVGAVSKAVIDPINLIPAAATTKGAIMLGTAIAGFGSIADDFVYSESGEVDPVKAGVSAATGGILSGAVVKGANVLIDRSAKKTVRNAQIVIDRGLRQGRLPSEAREILEEGGVNLDKLKAAQQRTGEKLRISPQKVEEKALEDTIVHDSSAGRLTNSAVDVGLGIISTRIRAINEAVFGRLRRMEYDMAVNTQSALRDAESWVKGFSELSEATRRDIARLLYNEEFDAARQLMGRGLADDFDMSIIPLLSKMGDDLLESGHSFQKIDNYFPRLVKDLKGLQDSLGVKQKTLIQKAQQRYADSKKVSVSKLTPEENAQIIDNLVRGFGLTINKNGKPAFLRQRKLVLTDDQMQYYADPSESLAIYLRRAVSDLEKRKFLGQWKTHDETTGLIDMDMSIGKYVRNELDAGRIRPEDELPLVEMLKSRFVGGDQSPNNVLGTMRDLGYMGTIANPISAVVQLGDLGTSGALNGFRNTMGGLFKSKDFKLIDLGIDEVSKELSEASSRGTAKALNKFMTVGGFRFMDRLGKETIINAAYKNAAKMVKTPKGLEKFRKKVGSIYGDETDALIADLQAGERTGRVKMFLFNELSDAQPISLSEFPQYYLDNPNQRILYMLKSFTLKQYDILRRNVVQEYAKGNKVEAVKNATRLAAYLTAANVGTQLTKDMLLGRDIDVDDLPSRSLWALLGVYGMNQYSADKYWSRGDWKGAVANQVLPAAPYVEGLWEGVTEPFEEDPDLGKAARTIPVVGPLLQNWFLGGAEKFNERQERKRKAREKYEY